MVEKLVIVFFVALGVLMIASGAYCAIAFSVALLQGDSLFGFPFDQMWIVLGCLFSWLGLKPFLEAWRDRSR
jgi:hypothetical protein